VEAADELAASVEVAVTDGDAGRASADLGSRLEHEHVRPAVPKVAGARPAGMAGPDPAVVCRS
jgi:hypothetical protein